MAVPVLVSIASFLARLGPWLARCWKQILVFWSLVSLWFSSHKRIIGGVVTAVILAPFVGLILKFLYEVIHFMGEFTEGAHKGVDAINSVNAPIVEFFGVWLARMNYFIPAGAIFTFTIILFILSFSLVMVAFVCLAVDVGVAWINVRVATSKFIQATKD